MSDLEQAVKVERCDYESTSKQEELYIQKYMQIVMLIGLRKKRKKDSVSERVLLRMLSIVCVPLKW